MEQSDQAGANASDAVERNKSLHWISPDPESSGLAARITAKGDQAQILPFDICSQNETDQADPLLFAPNERGLSASAASIDRFSRGFRTERAELDFETCPDAVEIRSFMVAEKLHAEPLGSVRGHPRRHG
jgi:hypothetical protein